MAIEGIVFGLWLVALVLVVWQGMLTAQIQRLRSGLRSDYGQSTDMVGLGLLYNNLIAELDRTADEKIALLESRIAELEELLDERNGGPVPDERVRHVAFDARRRRRCG